MEIPYYSETIFKDKKKMDIYEELEKMTLSEAITEYEKTMDGELVKDRIRREVTQGYIADELGLVTRESIQELLTEEFKTVINQLNQLEERFIKHRHERTKTYTEKPVW